MFKITTKNYNLFFKKINIKNIFIFFNSIELYINLLFNISKYRKNEFNEKNKILLFIHLGIGDFFHMMPAMQYISDKNDLTVLTKSININELIKLINNKYTIKPIEDVTIVNNYYEIDKVKLYKLYEGYKIVKTGKFNNKFSIYYPLSYYAELNLNTNLAYHENFEINSSYLSNSLIELLNKINHDYIFTHLTASNLELKNILILNENNSVILDPYVNRNKQYTLNWDIGQYYIDNKYSLIEHLYVMTNSKRSYLIDSLFFNYISHSKYSGELNVYMRTTYFHTLSKNLFRNVKNLYYV